MTEERESRISRKNLKDAGYPAVRRFARFLKLRNTEEMSDKQVLCLVWWRISRTEKKLRGMTLGY